MARESLVAGMIDERRNHMRQIEARIENSRVNDESATVRCPYNVHHAVWEGRSGARGPEPSLTGCGVW
jgi:hypothetical protein